MEAYLALKQGKTYSAEVQMRRKDGSLFWCHMTGGAVGLGDAMGPSIWIMQDVTERKHLQEELARTLAEREAILETTVVGIVLLEKRAVKWANAAMAQLLGYQREEFLGRTGDLGYPSLEAYQRIVKECYPILKAGAVYSTELEMRRKDGSLFWCHVTGRAISQQDASGWSIWVVQDITEKRAAQAALEARTHTLEQHRKVLVELAQLDEVDFDASLARILAASAQTLGVERVIYWDIAEDPRWASCHMLYRRSLNAIDPDATNMAFPAERFPSYFSAMISGKPVVVDRAQEDAIFSELVELYLKPQNIASVLGAPVWSRGRVVGVISHAHVGQPRHWIDQEVEFALSIAKTVSLALEASHRHELMNALVQSEQKYRHVIENANEGIAIIQDGLICFANPTALEMAGVTAEQAYGKSMLEFAHPDDRARLADIYQKRVRGEPTENNYLTRIFDRKGKVEWVRVSATLINWEGRPAVLSLYSDVTEQIRAEHEVRNALEKEKELSELKSRFVSMTSHEFRTPLATILSSAQLLEDYGERLPASDKAELMDYIKASVGRMSEMLDQVLLIGKADAGRLEFKPQPLDVKAFCSELVQNRRRTLDAKHELTYALLDADEPRMLDEKLLRHILSNLLDNAIKYSPSGGKVDLHVECDQHEARFEVSDQGLGIPLEDQPRLFETFHRGINVGNISGTGLGMAIVKRSVDLHAGRIVFDSAAGKGTRFVVTLPAPKSA